MKMEKIRINKYLADCGVCSRREADVLVEQKKVLVNGEIAQNGTRVTNKDIVKVHGKLVGQQEEKVVLAFYKPRGVVCTSKDKHATKVIKDVLKYPVRLTYAGRLDKESEGLLLMTNDGMLIKNLMTGSHYHEKEYLVKVNKEIDEKFLDAMKRGIYLKELDCTTRACEVEYIGKYSFRIVLTQGLNRQIRRMCDALTYSVVELKRVRVANITLNRLKRGEYRKIVGAELEELYRICKE
ncbi:MAG: pseudouridine synthase [Lachnospiraceae bacterium]